MNGSLYEQLAYDHLADLRRAASAHHRFASRADRAEGARHARRAPRLSFHRGATAVGCQA